MQYRCKSNRDESIESLLSLPQLHRAQKLQAFPIFWSAFASWDTIDYF